MEKLGRVEGYLMVSKSQSRMSLRYTAQVQDRGKVSYVNMNLVSCNVFSSAILTSWCPPILGVNVSDTEELFLFLASLRGFGIL